MKFQKRIGLLRFFFGVLLLGMCRQVPVTKAQGPAPESAPPLFPGGALVSYSSSFLTRGPMSGAGGGIPATARPTFSHEGDFNFTWGFRPNFDVTLIVPVVTNHFDGGIPGGAVARGTGLGDTLVAVKYRFYRRDSERGTTQASVSVGPKIPTGRTGLTDNIGRRLPASLQAGSGSTDMFVGVNWTYTGLFHLRRLVADEDFHALVRSAGTEATRLGNDVESRFWLSYRPYESKNVAREWFIGPELRWLHSGDDRISGVTQRGSGGDGLLAGITTFFGLRAGLHVWVGMDWDVAHTAGASFMPVRRHISFGITQQFRVHL
ncbi:MAG TPA: transporter [Candidatus Acidoferrum sp.]|nr:transporter [Candidatus Acidoferrum sp.]